jgi:signal transduction histidine kinase
LREPDPDAAATAAARLGGKPLETRYRIRLRSRFLLYFTTLIVAIMTLVMVGVEKRLGQMIVAQARKRGVAIARNLAAVSQASLVTYNYVALTQNAERAKREEEGIADVIILNKEQRIAAWSGHGDMQGAVLSDPVSLEAAAATRELVIPVELPRDDGSGTVDRALDISIPVYIEGSQEKWGTVRIRLLTEDMYRQIQETRLMLIGVGLAAVVLGMIGSFFLARRVTLPLQDLVSATVRASSGDMKTRIDIRTGDEIEELARNFDAMIRQLEANQAAIAELNRGLEEKVRIRTEDLQRANEELKKAYAERKQAETQLVLSEKMASLGQLVAGIAHEINTPSSAINAAIFNITGYLETLTRQLPQLAASGIPEALAPRFHQLMAKALAVDVTRRRSSTAEIRERSRALEAALEGGGFRSPRELALTFSRLSLHQELTEVVAAIGRDAPPLYVDFLENVGNLAIAVNDIRLSIEAITRMIKALKGYSHQDQAEMAEADIHDGIETTLTILRNQIKYGIVVERRYARLPRVTCNVNEINQVWTNIIHNAIQAMRGMGTLTIETTRKDGYVAVRISDTGPGIPPEIRSRIFDPFFTTKDQGEGSGLGLGIAQQIVQRHRGRIVVLSEPGSTSFEVLLPLQAQAAEAKA